jgi:hypothetical protein
LEASLQMTTATAATTYIRIVSDLHMYRQQLQQQQKHPAMHTKQIATEVLQCCSPVKALLVHHIAKIPLLLLDQHCITHHLYVTRYTQADTRLHQTCTRHVAANLGCCCCC